MKTLLNTTSPLSQGENVDSMLAERKQRQEQLFTAVVAEMAADETFRRRIYDKAKELGTGKCGAKKPPTWRAEAARRIVAACRRYGKQETIETLALTFQLERKQAERLYKEALASMPGRHIHRCL